MIAGSSVEFLRSDENPVRKIAGFLRNHLFHYQSFNGMLAAAMDRE